MTSRSIKETAEFIEAKLKEFCSEMGLKLSITEDCYTDRLILHFKSRNFSIVQMLDKEDIEYQDSQFINYLLDNTIRAVREKYKEALLKREKEMHEKDMKVKLDHDGLAMVDYRQCAANVLSLEEGWNTSTSNTDSSANVNLYNGTPEVEPDEIAEYAGAPLKYTIKYDPTLNSGMIEEAMNKLTKPLKELSTIDKLRKEIDTSLLHALEI